MEAVKPMEPQVRTLRLLLVDDELDVRKVCSDIFESAGYKVKAVGSAKDGARAALENPFDLAVIDHRLPDARGTSLVRWLHRRFPNLPVVMFSAYADWETFFRGCRCGARDVVAKALPPRELLRVIKNCLPHGRE